MGSWWHRDVTAAGKLPLMQAIKQLMDEVMAGPSAKEDREGPLAEEYALLAQAKCGLEGCADRAFSLSDEDRVPPVEDDLAAAWHSLSGQWQAIRTEVEGMEPERLRRQWHGRVLRELGYQPRPLRGLLQYAENRELLASGIKALDERERKIVQLRFVDGLTQSQIAAEIGVSQMHVSRLIRRALEKLGKEIQAP